MPRTKIMFGDEHPEGSYTEIEFIPGDDNDNAAFLTISRVNDNDDDARVFLTTRSRMHKFLSNCIELLEEEN